MPTITFFYDHPRWEEKAILESLRSLGARVETVRPGTGPLRIGQQGAVSDIAVVRNVSLSNALSSAFIAESWGLEPVNSSWTIYVAGDKIATLSLLARSGVPIPRTEVLQYRESAGGIEMEPPWVVKPVLGSWGRMVALARDRIELEQLLEYKEALRGLYSRVHIVQEYVEKPGRDIRVFTLGGEVLTAIYRVSSHWITNTSRGARAEPAPVDGELEDLASRVSDLMGGGFLGIDLMEHPDRGLLVNEVNAIPEFRNTVRVTGRRIHEDLARYIIGRARR